MQWRNNSSRDGALALAAHWLTALLVLASWLLGTYGDLLPRGTPGEVGLIVHMCMGLTVLMILLQRLAWRLIDQQPIPEPTHLGVWGDRRPVRARPRLPPWCRRDNAPPPSAVPICRAEIPSQDSVGNCAARRYRGRKARGAVRARPARR